MKKQYRIGPNRQVTSLESVRPRNEFTAYLDPSASKYQKESANYYYGPVSVKGCIEDTTFESFTGSNDPNFVGIEYLNYGYTITEGHTDPIIYEDLYFDEHNGYLYFRVQSRPGERLHIIFNRCIFNQYTAQHVIFYEIKDALIEFRNCEFRLNENYHFFFFRVATYTPTCTINLLNCVLDVDHLEHHTYVGNVEEEDIVYELFQQRDYVREPTEGYGPAYGTELISKNSPKICGYLTKDGTPVERELIFHNRFGKPMVSFYSDVNGYYEWDMWESFNLWEVLFTLVVGVDEPSLVIEDLTTIEHSYIEI